MKDSLILAVHRRGPRGFTLIELMIVVAIVAILAAVALPSYQSSVRKSRRTDAIATMQRVQQAQERWRANKPEYSGNLSTLGIASTSPDGYYTIDVLPMPLSSPLTGTAPLSTSYRITATPTAKGNQNRDTACASMILDLHAGATIYRRIQQGAVVSDAGICWGR